MNRIFIIIILCLFTYRTSFSQSLNLSFQHSVELDGELEFFVDFEYFDHTEAVVKYKRIFLEDRQQLSYNFNQSYPVEVKVKYNFLENSDEFKILLFPNNDLNLSINQSIESEYNFDQSDAYFTNHFNFNGPDAQRNKLFLLQESALDYLKYSRFNRKFPLKKSISKSVNLDKINQFSKSSIAHYNAFIGEKASRINFKDVEFIAFLKDRHQLKLAAQIFNRIDYNDIELDSVDYCALANGFIPNKNSELHYENIQLLADEIELDFFEELVEEDIYYMKGSAFETFLKSDYFLVDNQWKSIYKMKVNKAIKSQAYTDYGELLKELMVLHPNESEIIHQDFYDNVISYFYHIKEKQLTALINKTPLMPILKESILLDNISEGIEPYSHYSSLYVRNLAFPQSKKLGYMFKIHPVRKNWLDKAMVYHSKERVENSLNYYSNKTYNLSEFRGVAESIKYIKKGEDFYTKLLPVDNQLNVILSFNLYNMNNHEDYLFLVKRLKDVIGDGLIVTCIFDKDYKEKRLFMTVNRVLEAFADDQIKVDASYIVEDYSSVITFGTNNSGFPSSILMLDKDGYMPQLTYRVKDAIHKPELNYDQITTGKQVSNEVSDIDSDEDEIIIIEEAEPVDNQEEFVILDESELFEVEVEDAKQEELDYFVKEYHPSLKRERSFVEHIKQFQNTSIADKYQDFAKFIRQSFETSNGWYKSESGNTIILSKTLLNSFESQNAERWIINPKTKKLLVYKVKENEQLEEHSIQINVSKKTINIDGNKTYQITFYDQAIIVLEVL